MARTSWLHAVTLNAGILKSDDISIGLSATLNFNSGTLHDTSNLILISGDGLDDARNLISGRTLMVDATTTIDGTTLTLDGGTLITSTFDRINGGSFIWNDGILTADTVRFDHVNNGTGTLVPGSSPGTTIVEGDYTMGPGAAVKIELFSDGGGSPPVAGTDFDQMLWTPTLLRA